MADADKPNDPGQKTDLKARLGLKGRAAAAPAPGPLMPAGVQMPPPEPEPPKADARRTDATIPPRSENDNTPMPAALPGVERVRVEYVNISDGESNVQSQKTQRWVLIGSIVVVGAIAFFLGRSMAGSAASGEAVDARKIELNQKKAFLDGTKTSYQRMSSLADDLDKAVVALVKAKDANKDTLDADTEKAVGDAIASLSKYVADKVAIDPAQAVGKSAIDGDVTGQIVTFCAKTQEILALAKATLDEATAMAPLWVAPSGPSVQRRFMIEPTEVAIEGAKVPVAKAALITSPPEAPQAVQVKDPTGATTGIEYHWSVTVEGQKDPIDIKSTQFATADLGPVFAERAKGFKHYSFERLGVEFESLRDQLRNLNISKLQVAIETAQRQIGR